MQRQQATKAVVEGLHLNEQRQQKIRCNAFNVIEVSY